MPTHMHTHPLFQVQQCDMPGSPLELYRLAETILSTWVFPHSILEVRSQRKRRLPPGFLVLSANFLLELRKLPSDHPTHLRAPDSDYQSATNGPSLQLFSLTTINAKHLKWQFILPHWTFSKPHSWILPFLYGSGKKNRLKVFNISVQTYLANKQQNDLPLFVFRVIVYLQIKIASKLILLIMKIFNTLKYLCSWFRKIAIKNLDKEKLNNESDLLPY